MKLNYQCVEDKSKKLRVKNLYLVQKNFQYFYLKVGSQVSLYEIALEKSLKKEKVIVPLLYHKVIDDTFVGIYQYQSNLGTLEDLVIQEELSAYDKISYMKSILEMILLIHQNRDPKINALNLLISPTISCYPKVFHML
jgi:hypothetical protein